MSAKTKSRVGRPGLEYELLLASRGARCVGVDEVGRGCLAGPVVTAAVCLPQFILKAGVGRGEWWDEINDSKKIVAARREALSELIQRHALVQIAWCLTEEIDRWNILHASMIAMRRALVPFSGQASAVLVDGHLSPYERKFRCPANEAERLGFTHIETIVKGDQRSLSIAAASIVAKVYRDRWMTELDASYPGYGFGSHKGYSTPAHYKAIDALGACELHRKSFAPFKGSDLSRSGDCNGREHGKRNSTEVSVDV